MTPLHGAALASHRRKIAIDWARESLKRRDPNSVLDCVAFLRAATRAHGRTT